jgi:hypothetical protein
VNLSSTLNRQATTTQIRRQGTNARMQEVTRQSERAQARTRLVSEAKTISVKLIVSLLAVAAAATGLFFAWKAVVDPRWTGLAAFEIRGAHRRAPLEVARISGMEFGKSLAHLDIDAARTRLLADPWILEARVVRSWPRRVRLEIRERTPVAELSADRWIAADGTILPRRGTADLPHLSSHGFPGGRIPASLAGPALVAMGAMESQALTNFVQVSVLRDGSMELATGSGSPRLLVRPDDWKRALARWGALQRELGDRAALFSEIDLRHGSCAALRRAEGGA